MKCPNKGPQKLSTADLAAIDAICWKSVKLFLQKLPPEKFKEIIVGSKLDIEVKPLPKELRLEYLVVNRFQRQHYDPRGNLVYDSTLLAVTGQQFENHMYIMPCVNCHVVGDIGVGKTCLLCTYANNQFPDDYVPAMFHGPGMKVVVDDKAYTLALLDSVVPDNYERLLASSYQNTDVFLVCFSVVSPESLENVRKKWVPVVQKHCPRTPFLLVGTQTDLRDDAAAIQGLANNNQQPVTHAQGELIAQELKAVRYVECSALTQVGLKSVFDQAVLAAAELPAPKTKCAIL